MEARMVPPSAPPHFRPPVSRSPKGELELVVAHHFASLQSLLLREVETLIAEREQCMQETVAALHQELDEHRAAIMLVKKGGHGRDWPEAPEEEGGTPVMDAVPVTGDRPMTEDQGIESGHVPESVIAITERGAGELLPGIPNCMDRLVSSAPTTPSKVARVNLGSLFVTRKGSHPPKALCEILQFWPKPVGPLQRESGDGTRSPKGHKLFRLSGLNGDQNSCDYNNNSSSNTFELLPTWMVERNSFADRILAKRSVFDTARTLSDEDKSLNFGRLWSYRIRSFCPRFGVVNPSSPFACLWSITFMLVLCYELIVLPLSVFDLPKGGVLFTLACCAVLFWSADIVLSFNFGSFTKDGELIMGRKIIVTKYLKSWLLLDLTVLIMDWILLISDWADSTAAMVLRSWKALRYLRVLRVLRLCRLRKLRETMRLVDEFVNSEYFSICKNVCLNMLGILVISHFIGCAWFFVGKLEVAGSDSWVQKYSFDQNDWGYQYVTCMHWSLTQLTPGSMEVQPQNVQERSFAVIVLILGMAIFSSIVSSITAAVNNLKTISGRYDKQRWVLRRFFREQCIPHELQARVTRYADHIIRPKQKHVATHEVDLLKLVPHSLYMDVMLALFEKHISVHPLIQALYRQNKAVMQKTCCALQTVNVSKDDCLFCAGETAQAMFFIIVGQFNYQMLVDRTSLGPTQWFCEPVLWTQWVHQGRMDAIADSELLVLRSDIFQEVISHHRVVFGLVKVYGSEFVRRMNELARGEAGTNSTVENQTGSQCEGEVLSDLITIESAVALLE